MIATHTSSSLSNSSELILPGMLVPPSLVFFSFFRFSFLSFLSRSLSATPFLMKLNISICREGKFLMNFFFSYSRETNRLWVNDRKKFHTGYPNGFVRLEKKNSSQFVHISSIKKTLWHVNSSQVVQYSYVSVSRLTLATLTNLQ